MNSVEVKIPTFLCDTWWFGMTRRFSDEKFEELAKLRAGQGFTAIQLVVGIPPEVGPENQNASGLKGPAWDLTGKFNPDYLRSSRDRIKLLNSFGLTAIVYGAWGHQIEWLGEKRMTDWWKTVIKNVDDLDVIYCLTGESDLWIGEENKLLPDKTTGELNTYRIVPFLPPRIIHIGRKIARAIDQKNKQSKIAERHQRWSNVLSMVSTLTAKPVFIHVVPNMTSREAVSNPNLLAAVTVQTGHDPFARKLLWKLPLEITKNKPHANFINLEPWYESIKGGFGVEDQLYAYWASMMGGARAYCYGAHGVWNAGDGKFLGHWGEQSLSEAMKLDTPRLIGVNHKFFTESGFMDFDCVEIEEDEGGDLIQIKRSDKNNRSITYIPDISKISSPKQGRFFLPLEGIFAKDCPKYGQLIVVA